MRIYLCRHGDAVSEDEAGSDRDRWLSVRGRELARTLARLLKDQNVEPDCILSSPLPRAVQTAELIASGLDYFAPIATRRFLEPGAQPEVAARAIIAAGNSVLVVSHEPTISTLTAHLLGVPAVKPFRTAQCCAIEDRKPAFTARADTGLVTALFVD
jgi:phosphohistidine phosphatase